MKNPRLSHFLFMMIVSATILLVGCGTETKEMLVLSFTRVEPLANDYHYEGWAIIGGEAKSTGKFNVDTLGNIIDTDGAEIANGEFDVGFDMKDATAIVISIEPAGDTDEIPSSTKFLAGDVADDKADLMVEASQALGDDFMTAAGKYILATPVKFTAFLPQGKIEPRRDHNILGDFILNRGIQDISTVSPIADITEGPG